MWVQVRYNGMAAAISSERPVTLALWMLEQVDRMRSVCASSINQTSIEVVLDMHATSVEEANLPWPKASTEIDLDSLINLAAMLEASLAKPVLCSDGAL